MGQQAALTLNTVSYSPAGTSNGISSWVSRVGGVLNSFSNVTQRFITGSGARKMTKVTHRIEVPVVATADSTCSCAGALLRTSSCQIEFWLDPESTLAERTDLYLRVKDLVAATMFVASVENLDPAYG